MLVRAFVVIFALSLSACAIVPEPLQVPENTPLVGYNKAVVAGDDILGRRSTGLFHCSLYSTEELLKVAGGNQNQ